MTMHRALPRRTVLRGVGATLALPFLDAMVPAFARTAHAAAAPNRMVFVYVPNGIVMPQWTPETAGPIATLPAALPRVLEPMIPYRDDISILSGLTHNGGRALGDGPGDHARAGASYLTGVHPKKTYGADIHAGVSADQIAARHLGGETRFGSLELGCEPGLLGGNCDSGYSCAYSNSISWRTPSSPMPLEASPRAAFERLFGTEDVERDPVVRARQRSYDRSVLDVVLGDARRLSGTLGSTDRRKLDEYLFSVREIERRIASSERDAHAAPPDLDRPAPGLPGDFVQHVRLMFDLMTVALAADQTRVITLMVATELSNRVYREIGVSEAHHGLTHHRGDPVKIEKVTQINRFHVEQFAYFLEKLRGTADGDGSLLEHAMVVYGAGIADGNRHEHHDLPTLHRRPRRRPPYAGASRHLPGRDADGQPAADDAAPPGRAGRVDRRQHGRHSAPVGGVRTRTARWSSPRRDIACHRLGCRRPTLYRQRIVRDAATRAGIARCLLVEAGSAGPRLFKIVRYNCIKRERYWSFRIGKSHDPDERSSHHRFNCILWANLH